MRVRIIGAVLLFVGVLALVLIVSPLLLKPPGSPGRLIFTDYAMPDHIYTVDLYDLEAHTRTSLSRTEYEKVGSLWPIDEQQVYASMCFAQNNPMFCSGYVSGIFTPEAVKKFDVIKQIWQKGFGPPVWSLDGSHIAFVRIYPRTEDMPTRGDTFLMNADGINLLDPTPDEENNGYYFSWSPDSQQIAFACNEEQNLCFVNVDGSHLRKLDAIMNTKIRDIAWSPDGRQIAFSLSKIYSAELYLVNSDGSNMHRLLEAGSSYHAQPVWSPNGSKIAFRSDEPPNGSGEIYVIERDGTNLHNLSESLDGNEFGATWSPDSTKIAFFSSQYAEGMYLYVAQADGTHLERITDNHTWDLRDAGSPELFWIP